ncbi:MAG: hypothetical protein SGPRY_002677 [Prymnesium sp.]
MTGERAELCAGLGCAAAGGESKYSLGKLAERKRGGDIRAFLTGKEKPPLAGAKENGGALSRDQQSYSGCDNLAKRQKGLQQNLGFA